MAQYIYILINPSLAGLLKIGRTNRSPEQRAIELSNSTNMPTPFIVAYEEEVLDSYVAEKLVHQELTRQGFRVSDSREFFAISLKAAIQIVSQVAQALRESMPDTNVLVNDAEMSEDSAAEYYLSLGLKAMTGSENTLQDYGAARDFFERAIALGNVRAHLFLAYLYIGGNGVKQSSEKALKILKAGGDKGEPQCFKTMWDIYTGRTRLEMRHDGNAELCFQWFLDASGNGVGASELCDYLDHSYDMVGGHVNTWGKRKVLVSQLPGRFVSTVIDMLIERIQQACRQMRIARLAGISIDQAESMLDYEAPSSADLILFQLFLSKCIQHGDDLMRIALTGVEKEDLEYCFSMAKNVKETVDEYMPYISAP